MPVIEVSKKNVVALNWVFCICYPIRFKKNKIQAIINSSSKINTITPEYALNLGLKIYLINFRVQKIDGPTLETFRIVLASF